MATGTNEAQSVVNTCEEHQLQELSYFCKTCKKFICTKCVKTNHTRHDWDLISSFAKQLRMETPKLCQEIKQELPEYKQKITDVKVRNIQLKYMREKELQSLAETRVVLVEMVNEIVEKKTQQHKEITRNELRSIENEENDISNMLEYVVKMMTSLDTNIGTYSDYDLIEMQQRMMTEVEQLQALNVEKRGNIFTPGSPNSTALEQMVGVIRKDLLVSGAITEKRPRLCHLVKWGEFQGYGFNIHTDRDKAGQYIGRVDEGSPAKAAGLQVGDRVVEIDWINIENESHQQAVKRIKAKNEVRLLVVDAETDMQYRKKKKTIRSDIPEVLILSAASDARQCWNDY